MTCPTIVFSTNYTETFGAPFVPQLAGQDLRGRWVTLPAQTPMAPVTVVIAGNPIAVTVVPGVSTAITATQSTARIALGPRMIGAQPLRAAVSRGGTHLVVLDESSGPPRSVLLHVVRLQANAQQMTLGPYTVPASVTVNVADGLFGQLLLIWHDASATNATGRVARVARTDIRYPGSDALCVKSSATEGVNLIACRVRGSNRTIELLHNVTLNGTDALNLAAAQSLESKEIKPGRLSVAPNQLSFADTANSRTVMLNNAGNDMLEVRRIDGVPAPGGTSPVLDVIPARALPTCLFPGEALQIEFRRMNNAAGNGTYVISSEPALTGNDAPEGRITVGVAAAAAQALLTIGPGSQLSWPIGVVSPQYVTLTNRGNIALLVTIAAAGNGFTWTSPGATPNTQFRLRPADRVSLIIQPPNAAATSTFAISATDEQGTAIGGSPFSIELASGLSAKVNPGDLKIGVWMVDPAGADLAPEGEFIELMNASSPPRALDLSSVRVTERKFPVGTGTTAGGGTRADFFTFGPTTLNGDRFLPVGGSVRILTRAKVATDPPDFGPMPWRLYAGRGVAVWNNTGDTAAVMNRETNDVIIDQRVFVRPPPGVGGGGATAGGITAGGTAAAPKRVVGLSRRYFISPNVQWNTSLLLEDGDLVIVRQATGTMYLNRVFGFATSASGPEGQLDNPAGESTFVPFSGTFFSPLPGAASGALVARVRQGGTLADPFYVGAQLTFRVREIEATTAPLFVDFGVNDTYLGDNSGEYDAAVDVYRS